MAEQTNNQEQAIEAENTKFKFDKKFQEKIVQAMIVDRRWAGQFSEVVNVDYFQYAYLKLVVSKYLGYYKSYKEFPSLDMLASIVGKDLKKENNDVLRDQIKKLFVRTRNNEDLNDLHYVKDASLEFCKKAALQKALEQSVDLIQSESYDNVLDVVKKALAAGNENSPGLDLFNDIEARYSQTYRKAIPTGIPELDQRKILNGGVGGGELAVVVAPTGAGKTHVLTQMGAEALKNGKNVAHYTFELNERVTSIRYDSNLVDIPSIDCPEKKEEIKEYYTNNKKQMGRLIVKYYPSNAVTINTIRNHIDKLSTINFKPDLIIIDYAGIMRSTGRHELMRMELKKICEELREFANELDIPVWTAIQSNKEGANAEVVDLTNMAEAYSQAHVADFVLGLARKSEEKSTGFCSLYVAKNRAGADGIKYLANIDTSKSKLKVLTTEEAAEFRDDQMKVVRQKFKERNGE